MDAYQEIWTICASPFIIFYCIWEIHRGFYILIKKKYKSNIAFNVRLFILKTFYKKETADNYLENILKSPEVIYPSAIYSIVGGITTLIALTWLIAVLIRN